MVNFFGPYPIEPFQQPLLAVVEKEIRGDAPGRVFFNGVSWRARMTAIPSKGIKISPGATVQLYARQGLCLLVLAPRRHNEG